MAKSKACLHCKALFTYKSNKKIWCSNYCRNIQYKIKYPVKVAGQLLNWQRQNRSNLKKYRNIPQNKIASNLRSRLAKAIGRNQKTVSMSEYLCCSLPKLRTYLESKFQDGMSWDNYGAKGWHIDHIKPLDSFNLNNSNELKLACHYTNLQPLWAKDNRSKGSKYEKG